MASAPGKMLGPIWQVAHAATMLRPLRWTREGPSPMMCLRGCTAIGAGVPCGSGWYERHRICDTVSGHKCLDKVRVDSHGGYSGPVYRKFRLHHRRRRLGGLRDGE